VWILRNPFFVFEGGAQQAGPIRMRRAEGDEIEAETEIEAEKKGVVEIRKSKKKNFFHDSSIAMFTNN
jgi:hypothetical protein